MQRRRVCHTSIFKSRCIMGYVSLPASMETRADSGVAMERSLGWGRWRQAPSETGQPVWPWPSQTTGSGATGLSHLQGLWYLLFYRNPYWNIDSMCIHCHGNCPHTKVIFSFLLTRHNIKCESFVCSCIKFCSIVVVHVRLFVQRQNIRFQNRCHIWFLYPKYLSSLILLVNMHVHVTTTSTKNSFKRASLIHILRLHQSQSVL